MKQLLLSPHGFIKGALPLAAGLLVSVAAGSGWADSAPTPLLAADTSAVSGIVPTQVAVDRVVVRFSAPELGGAVAPRFVFQRELAFEARIEQMSDSQSEPEEGYPDSAIRAALERHIAETILEALPCSPAPSARDIELRVQEARLALEQRVGGAQRLAQALTSEGLDARELYRVLQRQARASLYLDRMVAPMLEPTQAELRLLHQSGRTPFSRQPYERVIQPLRRWLVASRLQSAIISYYEAARGRVQLEVVAAK